MGRSVAVLLASTSLRQPAAAGGGGSAWADGRAAISPFTGASDTGLNLSTNVSPNALLKSSSYPLPSVTSASAPGPLTQVPLASGSLWILNSPTSGDITDFTGLWGSPTQPYVYNNSASNLGGIIPAGGEIIDGFAYPAGTYVLQNQDVSKGRIALELGAPSIIFRSCRGREAMTSPGFVTTTGGGPGSYFANNLAYHFCDFGGNSSSPSLVAETAFSEGITAANFRIYRCYGSHWKHAAVMSNNVPGYYDVIENMFEKPSWDGSEHLNGIMIDGSGAQNNCSIYRNNVIYWDTDDSGNPVIATDCIMFAEDFGILPGTGTNADGTPGYQVIGNYVSGGTESVYLGYNPGQWSDSFVANMNLQDNLWSTSAYPTGGEFAPIAQPPAWGSNGNTESNNLWADGPNVGTSVI